MAILPRRQGQRTPQAGTRHRREQAAARHCRHLHASPTTTESLAHIAPLYAIEEKIRSKLADLRLNIRPIRARPLIDDLDHWMEKSLRWLSPWRGTAGAIRYVCSRWRALARSIKKGRLEIDNSAAERRWAPQALGRKNYLSVVSDAGGDRTAAFYSLIGTALNRIDPELYLRSVLRHDGFASRQPHRAASALEPRRRCGRRRQGRPIVTAQVPLIKYMRTYADLIFDIPKEMPRRSPTDQMYAYQSTSLPRAAFQFRSLRLHPAPPRHAFTVPHSPSFFPRPHPVQTARM
jgi:hypothetical protein